MKKYSGLDFTSAPKKKRPGLTVALIAVGVLLLGAASFLILLAKNDFDTAKFFGTRRPETSQSESTEASTSEEPSSTAPQFSDTDAVNFLFVCHDSSAVSFCSVVSVSVKENCIKVKAVPVDTTAELNGEKTDLSSSFRQSGVRGIAELLKSKGIETAKYVSVTEAAFKQTVGKLGSTVVELPHDIAFADGAVKYTFPAGKNTFTADLLLKLIKLGETGDNLSSLQAIVQASVIRQHLTSENFNKGASFFSSLINPIETDITAFDYSESSAAIGEFISSSPSTVPIG